MESFSQIYKRNSAKKEILTNKLSCFADISQISNENNSFVIQNIKPVSNPVDKIRRLFDYYCQIGDKLNANNLKSSKLHKMFHDAEILDNKITKKRLDLLITKSKKGKSHYLFDFDSFMHITMEVARYKYIQTATETNYSMTIKKAFNTLLSNHFYPLHDLLYESKQEKPTLDLTILTHHEAEIDDALLEVLSLAVDTLMDIYKFYFRTEISVNDDLAYVRKDSEKSFMKFARDFELIQGRLSYAALFQIFKIEINSKSTFVLPQNDHLNFVKGRLFTFSKFLNSLIKISNFLWAEFLHTKFLHLIEIMQNSKGFLEMEKTTNKTHSYLRTFIIPPNLISSYKEELNRFDHLESNQINSVELRQPNGQNKMKFIRKKNFEEIEYLKKKHGTMLYKVFIHYASFGENRYMINMKSSKFTKFLKESGLMSEEQGLKYNDVDTIFYQLVKGSGIRSKSAIRNDKDRVVVKDQPKINYESFLKALEIIAEINAFKPNLHDSVEVMVTEYLKPLAAKVRNTNLESLKLFVKYKDELVVS